MCCKRHAYRSLGISMSNDTLNESKLEASTFLTWLLSSHSVANSVSDDQADPSLALIYAH